MNILNFKSLSGKLNLVLLGFVVLMMAILAIFFSSIDKYSTYKDQLLEIENLSFNVQEVRLKVDDMVIDSLKVHGMMDNPNEVSILRDQIKKELKIVVDDMLLLVDSIKAVNDFGHEVKVKESHVTSARSYMESVISYMMENIVDVGASTTMSEDDKTAKLDAGTVKGVEMAEDFDKEWSLLNKELHDLEDNVLSDLQLSEKQAKNSVIAIVIFSLLALGAFILMTTRSIKSALMELMHGMSELAKSNSKFTVSEKSLAIKEIKEVFEVLEELKVYVDRAAKLENMVDNISMPIMVCDKSFIIKYMNKASKLAIKTIEKYMPITSDKIVGSSIDIFHKSPSHNRAILMDKVKLPHKAVFKIGDQWMSLTASMLTDLEGNFDGAYIDWNIITEEKRIKYSTDTALENINKLISSASQGDLAYRINTSDLEGVYKEICDNMNNLMNIISNPISNSIKVIQDLSKGSLIEKVDGEYAGMFKAMQESLNSTIDTLKNTVIKIKESSSAVKVASSEISAGSEDLSSRTEQQASNLEETAASMEELTETVQKNTTNAANANKFAGEARQIAEKGGKVVEDAVLAMGNIEKSSQKISDIIGVIDEIAFQTNLLALNAAVEAARAGDAGKGFAVVASEVRMLAGRSSSASKEIKQLIMESATQVKDGAVLVNQAGSTLTEIVTSVKKVADLVSDIANASVEQSNGIREINSAVLQMDQMTQQNAALVQENTAASQSLVSQADSLTKLVGFFKLSEEDEARLNSMIDNASRNAKASMQSAVNNVKKPVTTSPKPTDKIKSEQPTKKVSAMNKLAHDSRKEDNGGSSGAYSDGWEEF